MSNFITTIGKIAQVFDGPHATPEKTEFGPFFLSISSLENGTLDLSKSAHLSEKDFDKWTKRVTPQEGDVLFSYETRLGEAALMPAGIKACLGRRMGLLRADKTKVLPEFLLYAYLSPEFQETIRANTIHGATVDRIALKDLPNYPIRIPPLAGQIKVIAVLKSIYRKKELNTQTNQTLESIAQAIFKSWFVDFEPVKAKIATLAEGGTREQAELAAMGAISGKSEAELAQLQQQNPEHYQQLAETAALFPSAMVESELGEIPEGWEVNNLGVISSLITKGTTPTKSDISSAEDEPKTFFLKVKDIAESGEVIRNGIEKIPTSVSMGALKRSILKTDDVLFSIAGTIGRTAIVDSDLNSANANQALAIIRLSNPKKWLSFTWFNINSDRIQNEIASKVVQGVQANASLANIRDITITIPSDEILEYFNKIIDPILLKKRLLARNTRELSELRDSLLPKLLSGEIDLSNIQSEVA